LRNIYIHPNSLIGSNTEIGEGTNINGPAYIASRDIAPVKIGKYCAIAHNLRIRPRNHYTGYANLQDQLQNRYGFPNLSVVKGAVTIGNNVWIADNVTILSGATIGDGAVVGAGAIVTKDIAPFAIAVGCPAKVIRKRFSEKIIEKLISIQWWQWSEERIQRNKEFFSIDFSQYDDFPIHSIIVD